MNNRLGHVEIPKNILVCIHVNKFTGMGDEFDVYCYVRSDVKECYEYRIDIVAMDNEAWVSKDRFLDEAISEGFIKGWRPVTALDTPLLIGMPYTSPLLDNLLSGGSL